MADAATLTAVKTALGVTGDYMDATISLYIDGVIDYMRGAGVSDTLIAASVGVIARGVNDLWCNGSGGGDYSHIFINMVTQLALRSGGVSF